MVFNCKMLWQGELHPDFLLTPMAEEFVKKRILLADDHKIVAEGYEVCWSPNLNLRALLKTDEC